MNVLVGLYRPDAGEIRIDGRPASFGSPRDAIAAGIGMVHQHFTLVPSQTVTENILLGLDKPRFRLRLREAEAEVARIAATFGLRVDPGAKIWQLSVGEQQRVEILEAALPRGADPDHGRAHGGARAPGDRGAVRDAALDGRRRALGRVHQPQARRGARDRRSDHGHAQRAGHGGRPLPGGRDTGRPRAADGRPVGARDPGQDARRRRATSCWTSGASRRATTVG